jgi:aquaporin NIP
MGYRHLGTDLRKVAAEFIGTFAMVFAGCGAIAADHLSGGAVGHVGICLTFGLVVCVMIYATGHISGAHFNPAVSIGFASAGRFAWREVPAYVGAQASAAVLAIALLCFATGTTVVGETLPSQTLAQALVVEIILTFFLMFVISAVATDHRAVGQLAGVAIGGTVALCALFGGPLTGASMNPARSLGPAIFGSGLHWMGLYTLGPIIGALSGARCYEWLRCSEHPGEDAKGCC